MAFKFNEADIFFIQECSPLFEKKVDEKLYFKALDSDRETLVLVKKGFFQEHIPI